MWARLVCTPSLVPVLMCSFPNLCPSVSFYIAASANEVLPTQSQPLTFFTVLSGLRTECGVVRGPNFLVSDIW